MAHSHNIDILFALAGDLNRNSRALKQLRSLSRAGLRVQVLSLKKSAPMVDIPDGVSVQEISVDPVRGFRFFFDLRHKMEIAAAQTRPQCFHASDLYVLSALYHAAHRQNAGLTYDARECYPHVASTANRPWVRWYWQRHESRLIGRCNAVFTVSDSIADHISKTYGIERPVVVRNVPETDVPDNKSTAGTGRLRKMAGIEANIPVILHLGQLRKARGCQVLLKAIPFVPRAHLVFLGYGPEQDRLKELARQLSISDRVHFLPPVRPDRIVSTIGDASLGVTLLQDTCLNHRYALPNKLFDYIHAGVPVLASDLPEIGRIVSDNGFGKIVGPDDVSSLAACITEMLDDPEKLRVWSENEVTASETFSWTSASQAFVDAMRRVAAPSIDRPEESE